MTAERSAPVTSSSATSRLQWSRGRMTAERCQRALGCALVGAASMEPRSDDRGECVLAEKAHVAAEASMEPRSDDRGERVGRKGKAEG